MALRTQQYELYASEARLTDLGESFADSDALQLFVNDLRETYWWDKRYPRVVHVEAEFLDRSDSVGAWDDTCRQGRIEMSRRNHNNLQFVIHELAHVLAAAQKGSKSHDPKFARTYLELTSLIRGSDAFVTLKDAFDQDDIVYD